MVMTDSRECVPGTHLEHEVVLFQPALLCLLGLGTPVQGLAPVLRQFCHHLSQLILMGTQLFLLQR